jgi:hypothetical protein
MDLQVGEGVEVVELPPVLPEAVSDARAINGEAYSASDTERITVSSRNGGSYEKSECGTLMVAAAITVLRAGPRRGAIVWRA